MRCSDYSSKPADFVRRSKSVLHCSFHCSQRHAFLRYLLLMIVPTSDIAALIVERTHPQIDPTTGTTWKSELALHAS
jgi:hypothetical protein